MKLAYLVYREDNVLVYESQVLSYLRAFEAKGLFDSVELILFRHEQNLFRRAQAEARIHACVNRAKTFPSLPVFTMAQLTFNAGRLRRYLGRTYGRDEELALICRGDLAACVGVMALRDFPHGRVLYDVRGLACEESAMSHPGSLLHRINRRVKGRAMDRAKAHCDMYNFVTNPMGAYLAAEHGFDPAIPRTVIPTLYAPEEGTEADYERIVRREGYDPAQLVVTYMGSAAPWQSVDRLPGVIRKIAARYPSARFFLLTNGTIPGLGDLPEKIRQRIVQRSVPHGDIPGYLRMTDVGLVLRDGSVVNRVAAPTKIAEYLTGGATVLYSGDIGVIRDLRALCDGAKLISLDEDGDWLERISPENRPVREVDHRIRAYFDMDERQRETYEMIRRAFASAKVR